MKTAQFDNHLIDELFCKIIIPLLGTAETQEALRETKWIYESLCNHEPARENLGCLYQNFLQTYELVKERAAKQTTLDCIAFLNTKASTDPVMA